MNRFRFVHLNVHSHYSINDGCASIKELVDAAIKDKMPGVAITDNGNMFGVMEFFDYVTRINNERRQKGKNVCCTWCKGGQEALQAQQRLSLNSHSKELSRLQKHHQDC